MKTYTVEGTYHGKVIMKVRARDFAEALKRFENAEEDSVEIVDPSRIEFDPEKIEESK